MICGKIDAMLRDFWQGIDKEKGRGLYLKAWSAMCLPKEDGGLGFRMMREINVAFITKLV